MPRPEAKRKKAEEVYQTYLFYNNSRRKKWIADNQRSLEFYLNEQLTLTQKQNLTDAGMPDFTVNRVTPAVEVMLYFATANNPGWQVTGAESSDTDISEVFNAVHQHCWNLSDGKIHMSQVIRDAITRGAGYFHLYIDPNSDKGLGDVKFSWLNPNDVYWDPQCKDHLNRDAGGVIVKKLLTREQLVNLLPEHAAKIKKAVGYRYNDRVTSRQFDESPLFFPDEDTTSWDSVSGSYQDKLEYIERYRKVKQHMQMVYYHVPLPVEVEQQMRQEIEVQLEEFQKELEVGLQEQAAQLQQQAQGGEIIPQRAQLEMEKAQKQVQEALEAKKNELYTQLEEAKSKIQEEEMTNEQYNAVMANEELASQVIDAIEFYKPVVKVSIIVGDKWIDEYDLGITEYPIVPVSFYWHGTPFPMSAITPVVGKQQEINKAHQILIHNANLASNIRWTGEEGSVDVDEWEENSTVPGSFNVYKKGFQQPQPILPAPLNNAFFDIVKSGEADVEYLMGVSAGAMGNAQAQPDTYRGMVVNDEYGTRRMRYWISNILEPALTQMGKVFVEMSQIVYSSQRVLRIVTPNSAGVMESSEMEINMPIYNDLSQEVGRYNDYKTARFDIVVAPGSTLPTNRWAKREEYMQYFQAGIIDDIAMLAQTDLPNKEEIAKRKSLYSQMQQQIQGLTDQLKQFEGDKDTLMRMVMQRDIKLGTNEELLKMRAATQDVKATAKGVKAAVDAEATVASAQITGQEEQ